MLSVLDSLLPVLSITLNPDSIREMLKGSALSTSSTKMSLNDSALDDVLKKNVMSDLILESCREKTRKFW